MVRIEQEQNIEVLRQVALLLDRENQKLQKRLEEQARLIAQLQGKGESTEQLEIEMAWLQEQLAQRNRVLFGDSSEKRPHPKPAPAGEPVPRRGHGPRPQLALPTLDEVHELPEAERECRVCGGTLAEMTGQAEEADEITVVERRFVKVKHRRKKYRCACNANVVTAPGPPKLVAGGRYSVEFAVEVAAGKYLDHLPLHRQARIMGREGLEIDTQTLWDQVHALAGHLEPTYEALGKAVLAAPVVHADETHWRLLQKVEKKRWWVWAVATETAAFYRILDSRSREAAATLLADYHGTLLADGYGVYSALQRARPDLHLAHCWSHVRRKFVDAEPNYPGPCGEVLERIGELFAVEREVPRLGPLASAEERDAALELRRRLRQERSRPIVAQIRDWAYAQAPLPRSGLGEAIQYMLGLWPGLTRFLDDPRIPLDNNLVERGLRGPVVGRKNHYGSRSKRGAEVAAIFYTLFESAKLSGVEPKAYVLRAAHAAIAAKDTVTLPTVLLG